MINRKKGEHTMRSSEQITRMIIKSVFIGAVTLLMVGDFLISTAMAIPTLQLYIEGSTYDTDTDTWVIATTSPFKLWVIGDVGAYGPITDVKLSAAVSTSEIVGSSISLSSSTTGLIADPSTPI